MSYAAVAGAAVSVIGGVMGSKSAKKNQQASVNAQREAQRQRIEQGKILKSAERLRAEGDRRQLKDDFDFYNNMADKMRQEGDLEAAKFYEDKTNQISKQHEALQTEISRATQGVRDFAEGQRSRDIPGIEESLRERGAGREIARETSLEQAGAAEDIAGSAGVMREKLIGAGDRPQELDAVQSEIEASFAAAQNEAERQAAAKGGTLSPTQKLSLALNKAKAKGDASAKLRRGWTESRANMVSSLGNQVLSAGRTAGDLSGNAALLYEDTGERMAEYNRAYDQPILSATETEGARRVAAEENMGNLRLGALTGYQQQMSGNRLIQADTKQQARSGYTSGLLGLSDRALSADKAAIGVSDAAYASAAQSAADQARQAGERRQDSSRLVGEGIVKGVEAYSKWSDKKNKKKELPHE